MDYLGSLVLGFSIAAIPGPIFFEIIRRVLSKGFWNGFAVLLGEVAGNLALLSAVYLGAGIFLSNKQLVSFLFFAGGMILLYLGISALRQKKEDFEKPYSEKGPTAGPLAAGFCISVSSPIVLAFWISLAGSSLAAMPSAQAWLSIFLIVLGFVPFHLILAAVVHHTRRRIPAGFAL